MTGRTSVAAARGGLGPQRTGPEEGSRGVTAVAAVSALLSAAFLCALIRLCGTGVDLTDESYYLLFISNPRDYGFTVTQFGYLYGPLLSLLGGDLHLLRAVGALTLWGASLMLFALLLSRHTGLDKRLRVPLAYGAAAAVAPFYTLWIPTPGYNSLNLLGLMVTASGLILTLPPPPGGNGGGDLEDTPGPRFPGWLLTGAGGWLCFMAKPPTALALACLVLLWSIVSGWRAVRAAVLAAGTALALLLVSAWLIDGSPQAFMARYAAALADSRASGAGAEYSLLASLRLGDVLRDAGKTLPASAAALFLCGFLIASTSAARSARPYAILLGSCAAGFAGSLALDQAGWRLSPLQGWAPLALLAGCLARKAVSLASGAGGREHDGVRGGHGEPDGQDGQADRDSRDDRDSRGSRDYRDSHGAFGGAASAFLLLLLPLAYGLGSNNALPYSAPAASVFFLAAFLALARPGGRPSGHGHARLVTGAVVVTQLLALSGLAASWGHPYRQPDALWRQGVEAPLRAGDAAMTLSMPQATLLASVQALAARAGMPPGTPVIDLTGRNPGAVYAASGRTFASPFMVAGYDWSDATARAILRRTPCSALARAWAVVTDNPVHPPFDPEVLEAAGLELLPDYAAAFFVEGLLADGFPIPGKLFFLKPRDPENGLRRCLAAEAPGGARAADRQAG
jgi:hypothetical protein